MKFKNPLLVVEDLEKSKYFYRRVLGLQVIADFGANITLTGGICLQTKQSWVHMIGIGESELHFRTNASELYWEEDNFDAFIEKLTAIPEIQYIHPAMEHPWGQRAVRFYDPDYHIIEVGENIKFVCRRFLDSGMTEEETAARMDVPIGFVQSCLR